MAEANYVSGEDYVVEFLGYRFGFNADDFEERVTAAAVKLGLVVFWGRVGWASFRGSRRPRLIAAVVVAFLIVLVALTLLGVDLPRE